MEVWNVRTQRTTMWLYHVPRSMQVKSTRQNPVTELTEQFDKVGVGDHVVAELAVRGEALDGERGHRVARRVLEAVLVVRVASSLPHLKYT